MKGDFFRPVSMSIDSASPVRAQVLDEKQVEGGAGSIPILPPLEMGITFYIWNISLLEPYISAKIVMVAFYFLFFTPFKLSSNCHQT